MGMSPRYTVALAVPLNEDPTGGEDLPYGDDAIIVGSCPQAYSWKNGRLEIFYCGDEVEAIGVALLQGDWGDHISKPVDLAGLLENSRDLQLPLSQILHDKFGITEEPRVIIFGDYC